MKVGDFGCGVITRGYKPLCGDEYAYEGLAGTWPYIAPEQFDDIYGLNYGISTDYWAFGLVLLEVERPFYTKSVCDVGYLLICLCAEWLDRSLFKTNKLMALGLHSTTRRIMGAWKLSCACLR